VKAKQKARPAYAPGATRPFFSLNRDHARPNSRHYQHGYTFDRASRPHLHTALRPIFCLGPQAPRQLHGHANHFRDYRSAVVALDRFPYRRFG
jgi:hypothetical protein